MIALDFNTIQQALHAAPLIGIMVGAFCRLRRTTCQTVTVIRLAFWVLFGAAGLLLIMPAAHWLWPEWNKPPAYVPTWPVIVFAWTVLAVQTATARHWRHGVPYHYQKDSKP